MNKTKSKSVNPKRSDKLAAALGSATSCVCQKCGCKMVGHPGDDECEDCALPMLARAREAAARAVEEGHYQRTGERKTCGELLRKDLGFEESPNVKSDEQTRKI